MKRNQMTLVLTVLVTAGLIITSCTQTTTEEASPKIENTLISVSFFKDTTMVDPSILLEHIENYNRAIDSIGYPDAGYKVWLNQDENDKEIRFMINGFWPNQEVYDEIHNHELYKNAGKDLPEILEQIENVEYHRFTRIR